jgi:DNA-binding phage protein
MELSTLPWVLHNALTVVGFMGLAGGMAAWRDKNPQAVAASREVIDAAARVANLSQKEMAADLDMDQGQLSRALRDGGNFASLVILGIRHPVFGAALMSRLGELLRGASESPVERYERLVRELHTLPQKEPVKCEQVERDSSAA